MKHAIRRYVITDPAANLFWKMTCFWMHSDDDSSVYLVRFTPLLGESTFMSEVEAQETLKCFKKNKYVQADDYQADLKSLVVVPIKITYETDS